MANYNKVNKKNVFLSLSDLRANNWDIDCQENYINDINDDGGFYEDKIEIKNKWR